MNQERATALLVISETGVRRNEFHDLRLLVIGPPRFAISASRLLVALPPPGYLLFGAKDLFVAANHGRSPAHAIPKLGSGSGPDGAADCTFASPRAARLARMRSRFLL